MQYFQNCVTCNWLDEVLNFRKLKFSSFWWLLRTSSRIRANVAVYQAMSGSNPPCAMYGLTIYQFNSQQYPLFFQISNTMWIIQTICVDFFSRFSSLLARFISRIQLFLDMTLISWLMERWSIRWLNLYWIFANFFTNIFFLSGFFFLFAAPIVICLALGRAQAPSDDYVFENETTIRGNGVIFYELNSFKVSLF